MSEREDLHREDLLPAEAQSSEPSSTPAAAEGSVDPNVSEEEQPYDASPTSRSSESGIDPTAQQNARDSGLEDANAAAPEDNAHAIDSQDVVQDPSKDLARREAADAAVLAESRRHTRRSFIAATAVAAAGYGFYRWIDQSPDDGMQPAPLRKGFEANAAISRAVFRDHTLTPTYPLKDAKDLRVNGVYGLKKMLAPESWRLQLVGMRDDVGHPRFSGDVTAWQYRYVDQDSHEDQGHDTKVDPNAKTAEKMAPEPMLSQAKAGEERIGRMPRGKEEAGESDSTLEPRTSGLLLTMEDIVKLPRYDLVTQFKCIEGWSEVVHWAGVRMADFLETYPPALIEGREPRYVYMETPDGDYYTGYDLEVCRHPQTLLVTEMMGAPLTQFHGAPLRLHMPTKYGYKQIKRIGLISYTDEKPDDYWTKLGYDWYAGL